MTVPIIKRNLNLAVMVIVGAALDFFKGLARLLLLLRLFFSRLLLLNLCCNSTWLKKLSSSCEMQILGLFFCALEGCKLAKKKFFTRTTLGKRLLVSQCVTTVLSKTIKTVRAQLSIHSR